MAPITLTPTTLSPTNAPTSGTPTAPTTQASILPIIQAREQQISSTLLQSQDPNGQMVPSTVYKAQDLLAGVNAAVTGIAGLYFISNGIEGKLNIAAFLAESMKETILYDVCDENNWDLVGGVYPASNSCGQLGQSYQDYTCSAAEAYMQCPLDLNMQKTAATEAKWYGAPGPFFCAPKSVIPVSPGWNYNFQCNQPWANPPLNCSVYPGQKAGEWDYSKPYPNQAGRTDVQGCCWWGRGVIQLSGRCNVGKLNYFLGKGAADRGASAPFPDVDFCANPDEICSSTKHPELKWVSGLFYWMKDVQSFDSGGWSYQEQITKLAQNPNDQNARATFINAVSGIVNRGSPFAGNVDGLAQRAANFELAWAVFGPTALAVSEGGTGLVILPPGPVNQGAIAGGTVGGILGVGLIGFVLLRKRRASSKKNPANFSQIV